MKRSKAQLRATRKMIAANKRRMKSKRRGKKNPLNPVARAGTKRGGRKAARTRKANKAKRSRAAKKGHRARRAKRSKSRKSGKRKGSGRKPKRGYTQDSRLTKKQLAALKGARTRARNKRKKAAAAAKSRKKGKRKYSSKRKSPRKSKARKSGKRSAASYRKAGRKAARTRARRKAAQYDSGYSGGEYGESRRRRRRGKKRNPIAKARRRHKRRNPIARSGKLFGVRNPIPLEGGLDFFSGVFAVALGYIFAAGADRFGSTHALTSSSAQGGYVDAPAVGQIYNSEATSLPIWSSGMRIAFNALAIAAPLGLSAFIKDKGPKSFFQLMAFAAIARTVGKAAEDGLSMALASTSFGLRLYAPEMAAQSKLTGATTAALPAAAPGVFAGVPRTNVLAAAPQHSIQAPSGFEAPAQQHKPLGTLTGGTGFVATPTQQHVAGAPINSAPQSHGVSFNPWADTDRNRND